MPWQQESGLSGPWFMVFPVLWIAGWITASILYRRQRGKPIFPRIPADAIFKERTASGYSLRNFLMRFGGASNCLLVAVTERELIVTPFFPFNLLFLPELYGLEYRAPNSSVQITRSGGGFAGRWIQLEIARVNDDPLRFALRLRKPDAFIAALKPNSPANRGSRVP